MPDAVRRGDSLKPLLDRLLSVEADDAVGDLGVACESRTAVASSSAFLIRIRQASARSGSGEDTAFPENPMHEAARHVAPFLSLALAVDHEVDRNIEAPQLPTKSPILLAASIEVGLDHQQVQVAIRASLTPSARAEEDDVRIGSSRGKPASGLFNQSVIGDRHSLNRSCRLLQPALKLSEWDAPNNLGPTRILSPAISTQSSTALILSGLKSTMAIRMPVSR